LDQVGGVHPEPFEPAKRDADSLKSEATSAAQVSDPTLLRPEVPADRNID